MELFEATLLARQTAPPPPPGAPPGGPPAGLPQLPEFYKYPPFLNERAPLLSITITLVVVSWICCLFRLYVRFFSKRAPGWDDYFIILTMLSTTVGSVVLCLMTRLKLGRPIFELTQTERMVILKRIYIASLSYPISAAAMRIALLLQYLATFQRSTTIRTICKVTIIISTLHGLGFGLVTVFSCWPIHSFWDITVQGGKCWGFASRVNEEFLVSIITQVVSTAVLDMFVFVIPGWLYMKGEGGMGAGMSRKGRWSLIALFGLGSAAIICSLWRVVCVIQLRNKGSYDPVWNTATIMGLASYELHLAAICVALPIMWPVLKTTWDQIFVNVTYEVTVTEDYGGKFRSRKEATDIELQSVPASMASMNDPMLDKWEPFHGDETTGLGENTTAVVAEKGKRATRIKSWFRLP